MSCSIWAPSRREVTSRRHRYAPAIALQPTASVGQDCVVRNGGKTAFQVEPTVDHQVPSARHAGIRLRHEQCSSRKEPVPLRLARDRFGTVQGQGHDRPLSIGCLCDEYVPISLRVHAVCRSLSRSVFSAFSQAGRISARRSRCKASPTGWQRASTLSAPRTDRPSVRCSSVAVSFG